MRGRTESAAQCTLARPWHPAHPSTSYTTLYSQFRFLTAGAGAGAGKGDRIDRIATIGHYPTQSGMPWSFCGPPSTALHRKNGAEPDNSDLHSGPNG